MPKIGFRPNNKSESAYAGKPTSNFPSPNESPPKNLSPTQLRIDRSKPVYMSLGEWRSG